MVACTITGLPSVDRKCFTFIVEATGKECKDKEDCDVLHNGV